MYTYTYTCIEFSVGIRFNSMVCLYILQIREDWKYIAMVIDRLQLYIFLGVTIGGTIGILINAPHIFEYVDQQAVVDRIQSEST